METVLFLVSGQAISTPPASGDQLDQGYRAMYNLDFGAAHRAFEEWERIHPDDPFGPASDAAAFLFTEFERLGILRSEFLTETSSFLASHRLKPDSATKASFEKALARGRSLSEALMRSGQTPERALFGSIVCTALHADYLALIDKENWQALSEVKAATAQAEVLVAKNSEYKDAYLAPGVENYLVSQKGAAVRLFLKWTGAQVDKETGLKKLRIVAEQGHYFRPYAKILLAIAAVRDKNRPQAERLMAELAQEFPDNGLFKAEAKKMNCTPNC